MSQKEMQEKMVEDLKKWQKIENAAVVSTGKVIEKTDHPLIRQMMEVIQRDSQLHYHLHQMIIDSMTVQPFTLTPEDVAEVWDLIDADLEIEKKTVEVAEELIANAKGSHLTPQIYLLRYLLKDEEKHNFLLEALEQVKKNIYPYA